MEAMKSFLLLLITFLTPGACCSSSDILSCLSAGGVRNFSTISDPNYLELLTHSIKDLRFTRPLLPKPFAVIFPENTNQVAASVQCATKGSWTIRIRSGGHSFEGLSSVADDGEDYRFVIIDMMKLNRVTLELDSKTAWVQAGATLGDVYYAIGKSTGNYAFSAGMCPSVGSGGHFSGGGHGALARKYGLAADNILDAILVDADGRILDRAAMGEEVFWAIRGGGGGSWGVVAEWKIRLLKVPETVASFRVTRASQAAELWYKWQLVAPRLEDDFYLTMAILPVLKNGTNIGITLSFLGLFLGPKSSALVSINRAFPELGITSEECKEMSWVESTLFFDLFRDPKDGVTELEDLKRNIKADAFSKSKSDYVKDPLPMNAIEGVLEMVARQPKFRLVMMDTYGGIVSRIESDSIAFPHRNNLYAIQYSVGWEEEDDWRSDGFIDWIRKELYEYMRPLVSKNPRAVYVNYVDLDLGVMDWRNTNLCAVEVARAWGVMYFMGNYDRLVRAKTLIDPKNVFKNQQSIPPLNLNPERLAVI